MYFNALSWLARPDATTIWRSRSSGKVEFGALASSTMIWVRIKSRNIFVGRRVHHLHIVALLQELRHLFQVHVAAVGGVVETPVFVLLDYDRFLRHYLAFYA